VGWEALEHKTLFSEKFGGEKRALNQNIASHMPKLPTLLVQLNDLSVRSYAGQKRRSEGQPQNHSLVQVSSPTPAARYVLSLRSFFHVDTPATVTQKQSAS
jgi:hypothetical protein